MPSRLWSARRRWLACCLPYPPHSYQVDIVLTCGNAGTSGKIAGWRAGCLIGRLTDDTNTDPR